LAWIIEIIYQTCQSRCTANDFLNVVGNSTLEDRVGGIADMGVMDTWVKRTDRASCVVT
jgi:hypothetical protein